MGIVVRKNFVRLRDIKLVTREDMFQLGGQIINRITARTNMGVGADGQRFAPYSVPVMPKSTSELYNAEVQVGQGAVPTTTESTGPWPSGGRLTR